MKLPEHFGGVPGYVIDMLIENGFDTVEKVKSASIDDLIAINGIGTNRALLILKAIAEVDKYAEIEGEKRFRWVHGWRWTKEDGWSCRHFAGGTEIKTLRYNNKSGEIEVLIYTPE